MSLSWFQRKARLGTLLQSQGNEVEDGLALDRLLHGQNVIGQTSKTVELDMLRFQDKDVCVVAALEPGQFGVVDLVNCYHDGRVYVRKSIEKRFAIKTREQCSPQTERDILLQATKSNSPWAPHLLCAYQTPTHLNLIMRYAEGGTLWDVLQSSPYDGKLPEDELKWWAPQIISAIHWCHSQGFAHRDIKPHNFVLTPGARVLIIDFGSAAPLLPPQNDGSQLLPSRYCLVPCGTCDYISPEILRAHEEALVALEMDGNSTELPTGPREEVEGYGLETDWWSLGAMLYEMAYGVTPFFAKDIRQTYLKIMNHETSLQFDVSVPVSPDYQNLLCRLLTNRERRIGRKNVMEITEHPFFRDVDWSTLSDCSVPSNLHLPQFNYPETAPPSNGPTIQASDESHSLPFAFSALFQSSEGSSVGLSILQATPLRGNMPPFRANDMSSFIGFSWGPTKDAFPLTDSNVCLSNDHTSPINPKSSQHVLTPTPSSKTTTRVLHSFPFVTPVRSNSLSPFHTLPRMSTGRRSSRRAVSDREAMNQLVDCVGLSARKKVLESGRKPRILSSFSRSGTLKKELRFRPSHVLIDNSPRSKYRLPSSVAGSESSDTDIDGPPSPSPSPRPGSAMSMMSRRSGTPTVTGSYSQRTSTSRRTISNNDTVLSVPPTTRTSSPHHSQGVAEDGSAIEGSFEDALDAFERNHSSLMCDIMAIEKRFTDLWRGTG